MIPTTLPGALALFGAIAGWIAAVLTCMAYDDKFRVELELRHTELWKSLGSPGFRRDQQRGDKSIGFLWSGRYRQVGDKELTRLGDLARFSTLIMLLYAAGAGCFFSFAGHR